MNDWVIMSRCMYDNVILSLTVLRWHRFGLWDLSSVKTTCQKKKTNYSDNVLPFLGSGPEEVDDLCFHTYGEFSPSSSRPSPPQILVLWPKSQPRGPNPNLKAQVFVHFPSERDTYFRLVSDKIQTGQHLLSTFCPSPMNKKAVFAEVHAFHCL